MIAAVAAGIVFTCTPTAVWDGDGPIWCAEGPKIRLARIAAREIDGSCRPHHPCPAASGIAARNNLVELLGGAKGVVQPYGHIRVSGVKLSCRSHGNGKGSRTAAKCSAPGVGDLGRAQIAGGFALPWEIEFRGDRR